jgi:hypothetical protein
MGANSTANIYRAARAVSWAVEAGCTLVVDEKHCQVFRLVGLEQWIWDCLVLGYREERIHQIVACARKMTSQAAEREVSAVLGEWQSLGIVEAVGSSHG